VPTFKEIRAALEALCREDHLPGSRDDVAHEVDVTLCHNLRAAGFSVSAEVARTLPVGQQQARGHVARVTSDQARGSASYMFDAPTCLASSPILTQKGPPPRAPKKVQKGPPPERFNPTSCRKAPTKLGLDSREKDHTRPDRFKLLPRSQNCQLPRCFVQESQVRDRVVPTLLPTEEIERNFFKTLAENIKARHATGIPHARRHDPCKLGPLRPPNQTAVRTSNVLTTPHALPVVLGSILTTSH